MDPQTKPKAEAEVWKRELDIYQVVTILLPNLYNYSQTEARKKNSLAPQSEWSEWELDIW